MNRRIEAVIFDLDGTLLDTLADIAHAMNTVLARNGVPGHEEHAYRWMVGSGLRVLVERAVTAERRGDEQLLNEIAEGWKAEYAQHPVEKTRPYDGVRELLAALRGRTVPLAVLSNKDDALVRQIVDTLFAPDCFIAVRGMRTGIPAKPDPRSAIAVARELEVEPGQIIYLGDSDVDMETARNAGMVPVGAGWGFRGEQELRAAGAVTVLERPIELMRLMEEGIDDGSNE